MDFMIALCSIMVVNIVLSGDNAVVIALASRCLAPKQQKMAILWGSAGAIVLRVILTFVAVLLLQIPYVQFFGGILLIWIAGKLLVEDCHDENIEASQSLWTAVKTIIVADVVMSLDNTLAIAAVANGNWLLLIIGLALSIPLIVFGSQIIVKIMDRFPIVVYGGAALIAWTAGEMIVRDQQFGPTITQYVPHWFVPLIVTVGVVGIGFYVQRTRAAKKACSAKKESVRLTEN